MTKPYSEADVGQGRKGGDREYYAGAGERLLGGQNHKLPTNKIDVRESQLSIQEDEEPESLGGRGTEKTEMVPGLRDRDWKPPHNASYETLVLTDSTLNCKIRPAGFRPSGKYRQVKNTCLLSKIKTRCRIRGEAPKMAVCITMFNEDESELKTTLAGLLHNYNCLKLDKKHKFDKDDFLVVCVVDGYDRIPESFKQLARQKKFLDEEVLFQKGFMHTDRDGNWKMKNMRDVMAEGVDAADVPSNILHCFQVTSWDFGIPEDALKGRRINFMFCVKQRNDGKINSHKWFFQGICKFLKPKFCFLLDIGTRPDHYAVQKLYQYMIRNK